MLKIHGIIRSHGTHCSLRFTTATLASLPVLCHEILEWTCETGNRNNSRV